jgi:amino acid adenylation domain-containing protein
MDKTTDSHHKVVNNLELVLPSDLENQNLSGSHPVSDDLKQDFNLYALSGWLIQLARYADLTEIELKYQSLDSNYQWQTARLKITEQTTIESWHQSIKDLKLSFDSNNQDINAIPTAPESDEICCIVNGSLSEEHYALQWSIASLPLSLQVIANPDRFQLIPASAQQKHFQEIISHLVNGHKKLVSEIDCLPQQELETLVNLWNQTDRNYPLDLCVHQLVEKQVEQTPNQVAIRFKDKDITFKQLSELSSQFAGQLKAQKISKGDVVGLCLSRSPLWPIGMLAIWKVGAVFLPLEADLPNERLNYILKDSGCDLIVTQRQLESRFENSNVKTLCTDLDSLAAQTPFTEILAHSTDSLAYIIYTSGTTGMPKGVQVKHKGLSNLAYCQFERLSFQPNQRILQAVSFNFDASLHDVTFAFLSGSRLCIADENARLPGPAMVDFLKKEKINFLTLPPSALETLPIDELPDLHTILAVGEVCNASLVRRWAGKVKFFNGYGPTETTVGALIGECFPDEDKPTIGTPLANVKIYILDSRMKPVPIGAIGEIYVAGVGVAAGYLNQPEKTSKAFVNNPFSNSSNERLYKTGDKARYLEDGRVDFIGRIDGQVKISGKRIEVEEIESRSKAYSDVSSAAVIIHQSASAKKFIRLVVNLKDDISSPQESCRQLRRYLANYLPSYMLPSQILILKEMPMTINGKLDKTQLSNLTEYYEKQTAIVRSNSSIENITFVLKSIGENLLIPICYYASGDKELSSKEVEKEITPYLGNFSMPLSYFALGSFSSLSSDSEIEALPIPSNYQTKWSQHKSSPSSPTQKLLEASWLQFLDTDEIYLDDQFVDKGGDSLAAVKIIADILDKTGKELTGGDFYGGDFSYCAARLESKLTGTAIKESQSQSSYVPLPVQAFFFGSNKQYGVYHPSEFVNPKQRSILICAPFSNDYQRSRPLLQQLGSYLSSAGFPSLRFDFPGCGDSAGNPEEQTLESIQSSISSALNKLQERSNASSITIVAVRLSATIIANMKLPSNVNQLVLFDPIANTKQYINNKRQLHNATLNDPNHFQWRRKVRNNETYEELLGQPLSHHFIRQIQALSDGEDSQSNKGSSKIATAKIVSSGQKSARELDIDDAKYHLDYDCRWNDLEKVDSAIMNKELLSLVLMILRDNGYE